jgi:hypothetical protein
VRREVKKNELNGCKCNPNQIKMSRGGGRREPCKAPCFLGGRWQGFYLLGEKGFSFSVGKSRYYF